MSNCCGFGMELNVSHPLAGALVGHPARLIPLLDSPLLPSTGWPGVGHPGLEHLIDFEELREGYARLHFGQIACIP